MFSIICIRELQIKTRMRYHYNGLAGQNSKKLATPNAGRIWGNKNSHSLMMGMQNDPATMKDGGLFHETKHTLPI